MTTIAGYALRLLCAVVGLAERRPWIALLFGSAQLWGAYSVDSVAASVLLGAAGAFTFVGTGMLGGWHLREPEVEAQRRELRELRGARADAAMARQELARLKRAQRERGPYAPRQMN